MKTSEGKVVDHINGIKHDNRRENLRVTTVAKNNENKQISSRKTTSIYRGVFKAKGKKYWAECVTDGIKNKLGYFDNEIKAAEKRDQFIVHNKLDHMTLNFPEKREIYSKMEYIAPNAAIKKYIGVTYKQSTKNYEAKIDVDNKTISILISTNGIDCANAYDKYIVNNKILDKILNFPENFPDYNPSNVIKSVYKDIGNNLYELRDGIIIDKDDYDKVKYFNVYVGKNNYAKISTPAKLWELHRYLLKINDPAILVDHIDNDRLNNSKSNLRESNHKKNAQNRLKLKNASSVYYGVKKTKNNLYNAKIVKDGVAIFTKSSKSELEVAQYRDVYIIKYLKDEHYKLNFEWNDEKILSDLTKKLDDYMENIKYIRSSENVSKKELVKSKFIGVQRCKSGIYNYYNVEIVQNKKRVFTKMSPDDEICARYRDIYILTHLKNEGYKLNFNWNQDELKLWSQKLNKKAI